VEDEECLFEDQIEGISFQMADSFKPSPPTSVPRNLGISPPPFWNAARTVTLVLHSGATGTGGLNNDEPVSADDSASCGFEVDLGLMTTVDGVLSMNSTLEQILHRHPNCRDESTTAPGDSVTVVG
jgi:hypothetical protein